MEEGEDGGGKRHFAEGDGEGGGIHLNEGEWERVSATVFSRPDTCTMELVNSEM